jgi:CRISPR-associated protein Cmr5
MSKRTLEQRRAQNALKAAKAVARDGDSIQKNYSSYVDRMPATILMNGLGQALATERASAKESQRKSDEKAHLKLFNAMQSWLCSEDGPYSGHDVLEALVTNDEDHYLRAQAEALAWLEWHKKFCRAYLVTGASKS